MTPDQLKTLIESDATATALMAAKDDAACASRCVVIAPWIHKEKTFVERELFQTLTPMVAEPLLQKIEAFAAAATPPFTQNNALALIVKRGIKWIQTSEGGWNFGSTTTLDMVGALLSAAVITQADYDAIISLTLVPQTITSIEVEYVRTRI